MSGSRRPLLVFRRHVIFLELQPEEQHVIHSPSRDCHCCVVQLLLLLLLLPFACTYSRYDP